MRNDRWKRKKPKKGSINYEKISGIIITNTMLRTIP